MPTSAESAFMFDRRAPGQPLPWEWARQRLVAARNYWVATVGAHGPHVRPVWGVWRAEGLWFSTANPAVANALRDPRVSVHLESPADADEAVIVEGDLSRVRETEQLAPVLAEYNAKYGTDAEPTAEGMRDSQGAEGAMLLVRPRIVLGWSVDALDRATRWRAGPETSDLDDRGGDAARDLGDSDEVAW
ncbi:MAG TPA: pyridoxamine 5'-phosphate oxidase family protein [Pseudonocardiaceae bacterium]|nr:pyridoxamine 5'-phosphate oxidase family protein [Pseudonocardiaceae bacterium]